MKKLHAHMQHIELIQFDACPMFYLATDDDDDDDDDDKQAIDIMSICCTRTARACCNGGPSRGGTLFAFWLKNIYSGRHCHHHQPGVHISLIVSLVSLSWCLMTSKRADMWGARLSR